ncbi:MAG: DNA cytosine methyltransferase [Chloroflexota bacterium]
MTVRYVDLFAGCGGISLGLHKAGLQGLFAIEKNSDAFLTLKHNLIDTHKHFKWPEWLPVKNWNIDTLLKNEEDELRSLQGKVDLVVGGPPCQGFSLVGERRASDKRNRLIHSYLKFVKIVQPRVIMFENVYGFTIKFSDSRRYKKRAYSEIVISKLHDLGYTDAHGEIIDMSEFGVPQRRKRFIVIATREGLAGKIFDELRNGRKDFLASRGIDPKNSAQSALSDIEQKHGAVQSLDSKGFMAGVVSTEPESALQRYLRIVSDEAYTPDSHRFVNHTLRAQKVFAKLIQKAPRNKRINGDHRKKYGIKKRNVAVIDPQEPSLTITTIPDDFVHYSEPRVMTVRECARLQTFPDWFEFKGPYTTGGERRAKQTPRYTQVGNAVPPLFAEQVGLAIKRVLGK